MASLDAQRYAKQLVKLIGEDSCYVTDILFKRQLNLSAVPAQRFALYPLDANDPHTGSGSLGQLTGLRLGMG